MTAHLPEDTPTEWNQVITAVVSVSDGRLWLGTDCGLFIIERTGNELSLQNVTSIEGSITSLAWRSGLANKMKRSEEKRSFIFDSHTSHIPRQHITYHGSNGLYSTVVNPQRELSSVSTFGILVVGTNERVYIFDGDMWWFEWVSKWYSGQGGAVDGIPSSLTFTGAGDLFIGNNISLTRVNINYTYDRIGPLQGLPYNNIQSLYHSSYNSKTPPACLHSEADNTRSGTEGTLWVGTSRGFALYDVSSAQFQHYFYGNRWHPGEKILGFASSGGDSTVVLTDGGIAVVYPQLWTLEEKAKHYQAMLERHTRPPGIYCLLLYHVGLI